MNLILHCQLNLDLHCFIISDLSHVCVDSSAFRMSGGWTTAKRGTVPVPRRFDSKQLTVAPQLLSKLPSANMPACQACVQAQVTSTLVSVSQSAASQVLSTCHLKLQKRERERGDIGSSCCVAQLLRPTRQLRPAVRTRQNNPQTTGSTFCQPISLDNH